MKTVWIVDKEFSYDIYLENKTVCLTISAEDFIVYNLLYSKYLDRFESYVVKFKEIPKEISIKLTNKDYIEILKELSCELEEKRFFWLRVQLEMIKVNIARKLPRFWSV